MLERIVKDEAPHGRFGFLYLEWADAFMDDAERQRLADVTLEMLRLYAPHWTKLQSVAGEDGLTSEGFRLEHVRMLGWNDSESYARAARKAVRDDVLKPLEEFGIVPDRSATDALLREGTLGLEVLEG